MKRPRRAVLGALGLGLAGCTSTPTETQSAFPTASRPSSTPTADALAFSTETVQQSSTEAPARVRATLENTGDAAVEVGYGPALLFTDNADSDLSWPRELVLDPETYVGPSGDPYQSENGCWRFPDDEYQAIQSSLEWRKLSPGGRVREAYDIYTRGTGACLPAGTFLFEDEGYLGSEERALVLGLELQVDTDGRITAAGREPELAD